MIPPITKNKILTLIFSSKKGKPRPTIKNEILLIIERTPRVALLLISKPYIPNTGRPKPSYVNTNAMENILTTIFICKILNVEIMQLNVESNNA